MGLKFLNTYLSYFFPHLSCCTLVSACGYISALRLATSDGTLFKLTPPPTSVRRSATSVVTKVVNMFDIGIGKKKKVKVNKIQ